MVEQSQGVDSLMLDLAFTKCTDDGSVAIGNFCDRAKKLKELRLIEAEVNALRPEIRNTIASLKRRYKRHFAHEAK